MKKSTHTTHITHSAHTKIAPTCRDPVQEPLEKREGK